MLLNVVGLTPNVYLFTGEQWDADLGMYFLRARYMDPETGRFHTMDTFEGVRTDPQSLHKYLYAHANPVMFIDPSGKRGLAEVSLAVGAVAVLSGLAAITFTNQLVSIPAKARSLTSCLNACNYAELAAEVSTGISLGAGFIGLLMTVPASGVGAHVCYWTAVGGATAAGIGAIWSLSYDGIENAGESCRAACESRFGSTQSS